MWKLDRDPYYAELRDRYGLHLVRKGGFFVDTAEEDLPLDDVHWLCTPTHKVRRNLSPDTQRPVVLLCTGSYCPPHRGHVAMMEAAKQAVEEAGYTVVGGYLSPGHDEYIYAKNGGGAIPAPVRVALCAGATKESSWLTVDPWEALYRPCAVNFTDVHHRLQLYLQHHIRQDIEVVYVCGGDNARFALTYAVKGLCCVVTRPGHEGTVSKYKSWHHLQHDRVFWAVCNVKASSTEVRAGNLDMLPASVRQHMLGAERPINLMLRTEDEVVVQDLPGIGRHKWLCFLHDLHDIMADMFLGKVYTVALSAQKERVRHMELGPNTISLDPMIPGPYNLRMSRLFALGGYSHMGYQNRPGTPSVEEQVAHIPHGTYTLFDDDVVTGGTVRVAKSTLGDDRQVTKVCHLETSNGGSQDVADARDFLLGGYQAGLVVELPDGRKARAPYVYPYADPTARSSLPPERAMEFSQRVWELNAKIYRGTGIRVGDLPEHVRSLLTMAGYGVSDLVCQVCDEHALVMSTYQEG